MYNIAICICIKNMCHILIVIFQKICKLIYFELNSHFLLRLASLHRAESDFLARKNSEPSLARLVHLPSRAEPGSARLVSSRHVLETSVQSPTRVPRPQISMTTIHRHRRNTKGLKQTRESFLLLALLFARDSP